MVNKFVILLYIIQNIFEMFITRMTLKVHFSAALKIYLIYEKKSSLYLQQILRKMHRKASI